MSDDLTVIRAMTKGAYDLQLLRIQSGLRLCANFKSKLGLEPGSKSDPEPHDSEEDEEAKAVLDHLRTSYKRMCEGVARHRTLPSEEGFEGDELISSYPELQLCNQYFRLEEQEKQTFNQLSVALDKLAIWREYLKKGSPTKHGPQIGIGPAMGAVLVTYFKPELAPHPSQFYAYCGLDVVPEGPQDWHHQCTNCNHQWTEEATDEPEPICPECRSDEVDTSLPTLRGRGRSKRQEHLVEREYVAKDGTKKKRMSTTYQPWLKSRMLGVLAPLFLKMPDCPWRRYYDFRKHRVETDPRKQKCTSVEYKRVHAQWKKLGDESIADPSRDLWPPLRVHRDAMRVMMKAFLAEFWEKWRGLEGLPVGDGPTPNPRFVSYYEAKMGGVHHEVPPSARAAAE
jgi:ssDNA-binding Zn-finger/Zn-ribbon topoisomerase 1